MIAFLFLENQCQRLLLKIVPSKIVEMRRRGFRVIVGSTRDGTSLIFCVRAELELFFSSLSIFQAF